MGISLNTETATACDIARSSEDGSGGRWGAWGLRIEFCPARPWLSVQWHHVGWLGMFIAGVSKLALVATWPVVL